MRNNRHSSAWILVLMVLMGLIAASGSVSSARNQMESTFAATFIATQSVIQPDRGPAYTVIQRQGTIRHPWYPMASSFSIRFPQLDENMRAASGFNTLLKRFVDEQYKRFEADAIKDPPAGDTQFLGTDLSLDFRVNMWSDNILSVQLYGRLVLNGSVWPGGYIHGITYSLKTGKELLLADLFDQDMPWRGFLVRYTYAQLKQQKLSLAFDGNLADIWEWNLTEQGLLLTFDEIHVGHAGMQTLPEVAIPYAVLCQYVKTNSPLRAVACTGNT